MNRRDPSPLHPGLIRPADPLYRVDLAPETQETLGRRAQQTHPTAATTRGVPAWRWGRAVDPPRTTSAPVIFSPSDLEPGRGQDDSHTPTIRDVIERMKR
jgi:hypothetical protein